MPGVNSSSPASNHVLITGMSGVGKTVVVDELRRRGLACIDMDQPGWSWTGTDGHQHWNVPRLEAAMTAANVAHQELFVSGCAEEQAGLYHRFRAIILLSTPRETMLARIRSRAGNSFGQQPAELARILADVENIQPLLRKRCTHEIVTTMPVVEVVDRILALTRR
jgi:adenylate kinase family enzyme